MYENIIFIMNRVYFVTSRSKVYTGHHFPIRIGKSNDVQRRLKQLQAGIPFKLEVVGEIPHQNAHILEHTFHQKYDALRLDYNGQYKLHVQPSNSHKQTLFTKDWFALDTRTVTWEVERSKTVRYLDNLILEARFCQKYNISPYRLNQMVDRVNDELVSLMYRSLDENWSEYDVDTELLGLYGYAPDLECF